MQPRGLLIGSGFYASDADQHHKEEFLTSTWAPNTRASGRNIVIAYNADGGHQEWVDAVANSLKNTLGIDAVGAPQPTFATLRTQITDRTIGTAQLLLAKPQARPAPLLGKQPIQVRQQVGVVACVLAGLPQHVVRIGNGLA